MSKLGYLTERAQSFSVYLIFGGVIFGLWVLFTALRPKTPQNTASTTVGKVEAGGRVTTIFKNTPDSLKQGIYARVASDRASIGVFKDVMPNIDVSLGGGKDYDDEAFLEAEVRYKF